MIGSRCRPEGCVQWHHVVGVIGAEGLKLVDSRPKV